jgi:hypothetical protein
MLIEKSQVRSSVPNSHYNAFVHYLLFVQKFHSIHSVAPNGVLLPKLRVVQIVSNHGWIYEELAELLV